MNMFVRLIGFLTILTFMSPIALIQAQIQLEIIEELPGFGAP